MQDQPVRLRALTGGFLTMGLLLACSLCWSCRKKAPEPQPEQQAADSNIAETATTIRTQPAPSGRIPLRVLYVGLPGTERQKDFVTFLRKHFTQVDTADYNSFKEEQTHDCDVAILDKDGLEWAALDINVSPQYSRATVSLGVPGAFWVRRVSRKMGYM
jgi:hypothetical protein